LRWGPGGGYSCPNGAAFGEAFAQRSNLVSDCRFSLTILSCQTRLTSSFLLTTAGDAVISAVIMSKTRPQNHISRAKIPKTAALLATVGGPTQQDERDLER
jgi:hypothetical protein